MQGHEGESTMAGVSYNSLVVGTGTYRAEVARHPFFCILHRSHNHNIPETKQQLEMLGVIYKIYLYLAALFSLLFVKVG
jgi:hypothetical protein